MNRQVCSIATLIFVIVYSCAGRLLERTAQQRDSNAESSYAWTALKTGAETAIKNGNVQDAEGKLTQALQVAERELSNNGSVDAGKAASLDQLVADELRLVSLYERELDEAFKNHPSDAVGRPVLLAFLKKTVKLSRLNLSVMHKYRTPEDSQLLVVATLISKLEAKIAAVEQSSGL